MSEPPPFKRIKTGLEFVDLINECYDLKFRNLNKTEEEHNQLIKGTIKIRETIEQFSTSADVFFGSTKTFAKISWAKCLSLLLEDGPKSSGAVRILAERFSPGGGLL